MRHLHTNSIRTRAAAPQNPAKLYTGHPCPLPTFRHQPQEWVIDSADESADVSGIQRQEVVGNLHPEVGQYLRWCNYLRSETAGGRRPIPRSTQVAVRARYRIQVVQMWSEEHVELTCMMVNPLYFLYYVRKHTG